MPETDQATSAWYVLYTGKKSEGGTADRLHRAGIETYVPTGRRWKKPRHARDYRELTFPALPRYVFFRFHGTPDWQAVKGGGISVEQFYVDDALIELHTKNPDEGVSVISTKGIPAQIGDEIISGLREMETAGVFNLGRKPTRRGRRLTLKPNDEVMITDGPLEGYAATVRHTPRSSLVDVLIREFHRTVKIPMDKLAHAVA